MSEGYFIEDLKTGQSASFAKTITDADIVLFAGVSGDTNPVHLDQTFAEKTPFKTSVADFYLTNPIARASAVMAECSRLASGQMLTAAE